MTLEELESRLEGRTETQTFEVKGPCDWNAPSLAKDILAMANVKDGGIIVIGIEDNTFNRIGVNTAQRDTYNLDTMKDQIAPYADPNVDFKKEVLFECQ
jgi:predicted HTH transcriptional regulator